MFNTYLKVYIQYKYIEKILQESLQVVLILSLQ